MPKFGVITLFHLISVGLAVLGFWTFVIAGNCELILLIPISGAGVSLVMLAGIVQVCRYLYEIRCVLDMHRRGDLTPLPDLHQYAEAYQSQLPGRSNYPQPAAPQNGAADTQQAAPPPPPMLPLTPGGR